MSNTWHRYLILILFCMHTLTVYAQIERKLFVAKRTEKAPKIDGLPNEKVWQNAEKVSDFVQYEPYNGRLPSQTTRVALLYDNDAVYIAAWLMDSAPDSIYADLGARDAAEQLNADMFMFEISPFNNSSTSFLFMVSASGIQSDLKITGDNRDINWNAVWKSATKKTPEGWFVEMSIPHTELRFSTKKLQVWGVNFYRIIKRNEETITWNYIDNQVADGINQSGELIGVSDLKPPLRLSLRPFLSGYLQTADKGQNWNQSVKWGADLRYGISPGFTLDMILIPDFSQVREDDKLLNLSPFEVQYKEQRPFFIEGTELFNLGDVFYSKRIGARPRNYGNASSNLGENEIVSKNPVETNLINATKISGRTMQGIGLGLFNAITATAEAEILDTLSGDSRLQTTQALSNYNLLVFDNAVSKQFGYGLINTNLSAFADDYAANVTAGEFALSNIQSTYGISGQAAFSQIYDAGAKVDPGYSYQITVEKLSGAFRFKIQRQVLSDTYNPNDLGYLKHNNEISHKIYLDYDLKNPIGRIQNWKNRIYIKQASHFTSGNFVNLKIEYLSSIKFRNNYRVQLSTSTKPMGYNDYHEARTDGYILKQEKSYSNLLELSSDSRHNFWINAALGYDLQIAEQNNPLYLLILGSNLRLSSRLALNYTFEQQTTEWQTGFVNRASDGIIMGKRDVTTINNTVSFSYIITRRFSLDFRLRHYWSVATYRDFYLLDQNSRLHPFVDPAWNPDIAYNAFNSNVSLRWEFAPGSEMLLVWKNNIATENQITYMNYVENLEHTLELPKINNLSLKIAMHLDYNNFTKSKNRERNLR